MKRSSRNAAWWVSSAELDGWMSTRDIDGECTICILQNVMLRSACLVDVNRIGLRNREARAIIYCYLGL